MLSYDCDSIYITYIIKILSIIIMHIIENKKIDTDILFFKI